MSDEQSSEQDSWLGGLGVNVSGFIDTVENAATSVVQAATAVGQTIQGAAGGVVDAASGFVVGPTGPAAAATGAGTNGDGGFFDDLTKKAGELLDEAEQEVSEVVDDAKEWVEEKYDEAKEFVDKALGEEKQVEEEEADAKADAAQAMIEKTKRAVAIMQRLAAEAESVQSWPGQPTGCKDERLTVIKYAIGLAGVTVMAINTVPTVTTGWGIAVIAAQFGAIFVMGDNLVVASKAYRSCQERQVAIARKGLEDAMNRAGERDRTRRLKELIERGEKCIGQLNQSTGVIESAMNELKALGS